MSHLLFMRGGQPSFRVALKSSTLKIGRASKCDLVLDEPEISREHAAIFFIEGGYLLKKISKAPLKVNGKDVDSCHLTGGEKISFGPWEAEFSLAAETPASEETTAFTRGEESKTQAVAAGVRGLVFQNLCLQVQQPGKPPKRFLPKSDTIAVGAGEQNDLVLPDPTVSTRHLKIVRQNGNLKVYDLGSTNGTTVNGVKIREAELEDGFVIGLGSCQILVTQENTQEKARPLKVDRFLGLIGASRGMQELYGLLQRVGPSEATVLILGESGTGKELVSRAIHSLSSRSRRPFVAINCGAISPELIESELFGHEKGAFTGAQRQHDGAVGQASGGTLFLDEIGELPLELQPKLLRILENRTYRRVGGSEELTADIRVIAATHRDLGHAVQERSFREDLFFRLFVLPIALQPLRNRKEDVPLLCAEFLKEFAVSSAPKELSPSALEKLQEHPFYGNVRELKNVLLRAVILCHGNKIEAKDLLFSGDFSTPRSGDPQKDEGVLERLAEMEKRLVLKALSSHRWNKARAAESLGVAKSTLFAKIKLYDLSEPKED